MQQTKSASESAASLPPDGSARPGTWPAPFLRVQRSVLLSFPVAFSACDSKSAVRVLPKQRHPRQPYGYVDVCIYGTNPLFLL